jgi:3',5'-cyclic AMP phosphodiesterase CpdA
MRDKTFASFPRLLLRVLLTLSLWLLSDRTAHAADDARRPFQPFELALLGDPQIGYGPGGEYADAARFRALVGALNEKGPPLVLIPGDLVQGRSFWQRWAFDRALSKLQARALLAPGNHDVVDMDSLRAYRAAYGRDYYDVVQNDCAFVVLNSETARSRRISSSEFDAQWRFIEGTLAKHHALGRRHIVLVGHRPPFVSEEDEMDSERNWPAETRTRLLALAKRHGVRWFLAGHLHRNHTATVPDGLNVVVVAGTSRTFDQSPVGYRRFRVEADRLTHEWVQVAPAPAPPFTVPGFREWTPRLFDFSLRHWILTLLYLGAAFAAWVTGKRLSRRGAKSPRGGNLWQAIGIVLFALGANMQLDVDELLRDTGRAAAKITGIEPIRHVITGTGLVIVTVFGVVWLARRWSASARSRRTTVALALVTVPGAWFVLSTISHHDIGMVFDEGWWDVLNTLALAGIATCALFERRGALRTA